jgi:uncharacterized membrane protein
MDNKYVGYIVVGISVLIILIIFLFNSALNEIVSLSCGSEHSLTCPMAQTVNQQTYLSFGIVGILIILGLVLIFNKQREKIIIRKVKERKMEKKIDLSDLRKEDKEVLKLIKENKAVFQADLIEKTGFGKAKMTRIIDRLEGKGIVERKRRGMTNVVVLKED